MTSNAEFERQKLLFHQKTEFLETRLSEFEKKEKVFNGEMITIKKEQTTQIKEKLIDYENNKIFTNTPTLRFSVL